LGRDGAWSHPADLGEQLGVLALPVLTYGSTLRSGSQEAGAAHPSFCGVYGSRLVASRAGITWFSASIVLLSVLLVPSRAGAQERDPWWGRDKAAHLTASMGVASLTYGVVRSQTERRELAVAAGFGVSVAVGAAKEALDLAGLGTPSWKDFAWDLIGAAAGVLLSLGIDVGVSAAFGAR
jgi:putative lipoprotein